MHRESVILSAIRSFCIALCAVIGIVVALFLVSLAIMGMGNKAPVGTYDYMLMADESGARRVLPSNAPAVLWVNIDGEIGGDTINSTAIADLFVESREGVLDGDRVKAVLLHINSPGGTAMDSENIYNLLLEYKSRFKVPVYAYVDGLCASGGMMVACAADKIYATNSSVIGSVGVISNFFNVAQLMEKVGVQSLVLTEGKGKDALWPFRPWQPGEDKNILQVMDYLYNNFLDIVTKARPKLSRSALVDTLGAQVYVAPAALELGYIDVVADTCATALHDLVQAAGIEGEYQVIALYPSRWLGDLFDMKSPLLTGRVHHTFDLPTTLRPEFANQFLFLYQP
jgi:protease-4